jgi:segregation and condensation protein A
VKPDVSIFDLLNAVNVVLQRIAQKEASSREIYEDKWTVSEKIEHVMKTISERPRLKFSELFADATSRTEVVVTFLALLELIRLKQIVCSQPEAFGEIEISRSQSAVATIASPATEPWKVAQPDTQTA